MGYTPKHARPASLADGARGSRTGLFAISGTRRGRHAGTDTTAAGTDATASPAAAIGGAAVGAAAPGREDETAAPERSAEAA